jgi:hypothetical protein
MASITGEGAWRGGGGCIRITSPGGRAGEVEPVQAYGPRRGFVRRLVRRHGRLRSLVAKRLHYLTEGQGLSRTSVLRSILIGSNPVQCRRITRQSPDSQCSDSGGTGLVRSLLPSKRISGRPVRPSGAAVPATEAPHRQTPVSAAKLHASIGDCRGLE